MTASTPNRAVQAQVACPTPTGAEATAQPDVRRGHEIRFRHRLDGISRALLSERYNIIIIVGSLVQFWPHASAERVFPGLKVLNAGVAGDGVAVLLHRLDQRLTEATVNGRHVTLGVIGWAQQNPATVLILLGTNDLRRSPPCDVAAWLMAVTGRVRRIWPATQILVLSLLPRGESLDELKGESSTINARLAAGAGAAPSHYRFVDVHSALLCNEPGCQLRRPPNYVHMTNEGYARLVAALRDKLETSSR